MKLKKLTLEKYKSFQSPTEIAFPTGTAGKSLFLIGGMNGAGKSSIASYKWGRQEESLELQGDDKVKLRRYLHVSISRSGKEPAFHGD